MFKSVALPQGGAPCNTGKGNIPQPTRASNLHHRSSTGSRKSVLAHANIDVKTTDAELKVLMEENNRLRKVMLDAAGKMGPEARQRFIKDYEKIAESAVKLGLQVDSDLTKAATEASKPSGAPQASKGPIMPDLSKAPRPPSFASFPPTPTSGSKQNEAVDSKGYLMDIMNLSVDLDPEDDNDHHGAPAFPNPEPDIPSPPGPAKDMVDWEGARKMIASHDPEEWVAEKHHWMIVTVPEKPVAGEEFIVYFNRNASDALRGRPMIQMKYGFNKWELKPESGTGQEISDTINLKPSGITRNMGSDFWTCRFRVPLDSFELNFVLNDTEGRFENNQNQDFTFPVVGGITWDEWVDQAAVRKAKAAAKAAAAEKMAAEEAERARQTAMTQQDKEKGKSKATDLATNYESLRTPVGGDECWKTVPPKVLAGSKVVLKYNRLAGPLARLQVNADQTVTLRYGFNNWQRPVAVEMKRSPVAVKAAAELSVAAAELSVAAAVAADDKEEWWEAEVNVPMEAAAVNFVVNFFEHYDNNNTKDYKILVSLPAGVSSVEAWSQSLSDMFFNQFRDARLAAENEARMREEARMIKRRGAQAFVRAVERRKVRHVLYTEPEVVKAGEEVTVFYNPSVTNLNGRERIYLRGGWNRWSHARKFGPLPMSPPAAGSSHWKAVVKAPLDAFKMDFVFSDVEEGDGTYDTRGGYDYHLPVEGSPVKEPSLYIAHIAVEMAPIAKVGGLGDVVTALGRAVKDQGHMVEVILPKFQFFNSSPILSGQMKYETEFDWGGTRIYVSTAIVEGLRCFFIEPRNGFFDTPTVYGRYDDEVRFDFFCKAALEFLLRSNRQPDILHCHDWSTAYVSKTYWDDYHPFGLWKPKVVFTIHNLNYGKAKLSQAAYYSQRFTTVSPTYAYEVGGSPVISSQVHKFGGIRNGIDMELWDPENNQWLPMPYNSENVVEGKKAARKALRERVGLGGWGDKFIVGVVSRLTGQKGVHLIKHAAYRAVERGGQFILLGSAPDPKVQAEFNALAQTYNGDVARFCFKYDEPLSHLIYAACDMIVVPSMFEPCGLTQMIAMRYGSVPIVRHTGGLRDTVFDVDFDKARAAWDVYGSSDWQRDGLDATNGFAFDGTDPGALDYALNRAIDAWYNNREWFHGLQKRVMEQDWSWNRPALDYIELYHGAMKS